MNNNHYHSDISNGGIAEFFNDSNIFLTGGTGFLGKVLVEKFLRCCEGIDSIYLLLRPKKGLDVQQRLCDLLKGPIFNKIKETNPKALQKLQIVHGDISLPNLGLTSKDIAILKDNINFVIHSAATVSFSENLRTAVTLNTMGTKRIVDLCKEMKKLKSFVYVSTAYSNPYRKTVNEEIYEQKYHHKTVINFVENFSDEDVAVLSRNILAEHPNTYTLTKALAEQIVSENSAAFPCCIVRPSIITSSWREPYEGWVDSYAGITGIFMECSRGTISSVVCDENCIMDLIPVDVVANTIIAALRQTAIFRLDKLKIYNCTSGHINPIRCREFQRVSNKYFPACPSKYVMLWPNFTFRRNEFVHSLVAFFYHRLPALVFDIYMYIRWRKTIMLRTGRKFWTAMDKIKYFTTKEWDFRTDNMEKLIRIVKDCPDGEKFNIDMKVTNGFNWEKYLKDYILGIRLYLLKDDIKSLSKAKAKLTRIYWFQKILQLISIFCILKFYYRFI